MLRTISLAAVLVGLATLSLRADDSEKAGSLEKGAVSAAECFDQLKKLEGEWVGTFQYGEEETGETTVRYKLTGAGSALVEHLFEGTDHEMITVYHLDGDRLILTHYCAAQNQPRMCAKSGDDAKTIAFEFLDGTNMDPKKDMHMHDATITFVDDDHFQSEWTSHMDGKPSGKAKFDLKRKKG